MADLLGRGAVPVLALLLAGGCVEDRGAPGGPDAGTDSSTAEAVTDVPASDAADPDLPPELPADGLLPGEDTQVTCEPGTKQCQDGDTALLCMGGLWVVSQECQAGQLCLDGACVPAEDCAPGVISGCWSFTARKLCHPSGKGWVPAPCAADEQCLDGVCATLTCVPGTKQCASPTAFQECLADGSDWGPLQGCAETESCVGGACLDACAGDIKYNRSSVGCEFWSVDLGQWDVKPGESSIEPSASTIPHAVVVGNPGEQPVTVTFQTGDGTPVAVGNPVIPPGQSRAFLMPVFSLQYTGIFRKTIRLRTNRPVTAAQFNPPNNEDFVHTSDASLLYPTTILGKEHYAVTTASRLGPTMPVIGKMPSTWGYVTVVAVEPGLTEVTVGPLAAPTEAGESVEAHAKGDTFTVELEQWEVLNLQGKTFDLFATPEDLTGTRILATARVAVFGGHDCDVVGDSNCDHLETQLLPVEAWGSEVIAGRMDTPSPNQYRLVSGADGNVLTVDPPVDGLSGETLAKGEWRHVEADFSFRVLGTGPLQLVQLIAGNSEGGGIMVDPSMTALVPAAAYRADYPLLVPTAYDKNRVCIVRPAGAALALDGAPLNAAFLDVPGTGWQVANVQVSEGVHAITGEQPFGLVAYGYATKVSYAYPGGLNGAPEE